MVHVIFEVRLLVSIYLRQIQKLRQIPTVCYKGKSCGSFLWTFFTLECPGTDESWGGDFGERRREGRSWEGPDRSFSLRVGSTRSNTSSVDEENSGQDLRPVVSARFFVHL